MSAAVAKARHPLLAAYLAQLLLHPLRTKMLTTGTLTFLQEVLASHLAGVPPRATRPWDPALERFIARSQVNTKALKMFIYGALVSAPLAHVLMSALQRAFAGRTGGKAKLGQILASNLVVAPIQTVAFLASMAVINGAKSLRDVKRTTQMGFLPVIRVTWITSPLALVFAQKFVSPELWGPFFNLVQFVLGTVMNTKVKRIQLAKDKKKDKPT